MDSFLKSSVGKKLVVSISGLFLIMFLAIHLTINLFLLAGPQAYNMAVHFMDTNLAVRITKPVLAVGFLLHISYSAILAISNIGNCRQKYAVVDQSKTSSWSSRNMFLLGSLIFIFLVLHLSNYWYKMNFGEMNYVDYEGIKIQDAFSLVTAKFVVWWYVLIYVAGAVLLGLHLLHGFQSAFQTLGLYNKIWRRRLSIIGIAYSLIITAGFSVIPVFFLLDAVLC